MARFLGTTLLVSLLGAAMYVSSAVRAEPPRPEFQDALWIADRNGASKILLPEAQLALRIEEATGLESIALDERGGIAWLYGAGELSLYDFAGSLRTAVSIPATTLLSIERCAGALPDLARGHVVVDPINGHAWLGAQKKLYKISDQGQVQSVITLPTEVTGLRILCKTPLHGTIPS